MKILFRDLNKDVCSALRQSFHNVEDVLVQHCNIFDRYPNGNELKADAIISPANCTGNMEGGIDQAYLNHFGYHVQDKLIDILKNHWNGHLPIGEAQCVPTNNTDIPWIISAPTMDWPPGDVSTTSNAYLAFKAALKIANERHMETIVCPGMCTLTGNMNPYFAAHQMRSAFNEVMLKNT